MYLQDIYEHYPNYFVEPCIRGMLSFDWDFYISNKKKVHFVLDILEYFDVDKILIIFRAIC